MSNAKSYDVVVFQVNGQLLPSTGGFERGQKNVTST
jgi:hypothetical protein